MGKKLRNREVITDIECSSELNQTDFQPCKTVSLSSFRKHLKTRMQKLELDSLQRKRKNFRKNIETRYIGHHLDSSLFSCSICLQLMVTPTMLLCGHTYCYRCLDSNRALSKRCSLCREEDDNGISIPSRIIQNFVEEFVVPSSPVEEMMSHLCKVTDSRQWIKKRRVGIVRIGQLVDYRTSYGNWIPAVIKNFASVNDVTIKYKIQNCELTEVLPIRSQRIARFTFFTKKRYLQDFSSNFFAEMQENIQNIQTQELPIFLSESEDFNFSSRREEGADFPSDQREETLEMFNFMRDDDLEMLNFY